MAKKTLYVLTCLAITGAGGNFLRHKDEKGKLIQYTEDQLGDVSQLIKEGRIEKVKEKGSNQDDELAPLKAEYKELAGKDAPKTWKANKLTEAIEVLKAEALEETEAKELEALKAEYVEKGGEEELEEGVTAEELKAKIEALEA